MILIFMEEFDKLRNVWVYQVCGKGIFGIKGKSLLQEKLFQAGKMVEIFEKWLLFKFNREYGKKM